MQEIFIDLIVEGRNTVFVPIDYKIAQISARLRASTRLSLADSLQIATAVSADCDAILTNDSDMKQVQEIKVIVLADVINK